MRGVHGGKAQARQRALSPTPINITIAYSGPRHPAYSNNAVLEWFKAGFIVSDKNPDGFRAKHMGRLDWFLRVAVDQQEDFTVSISQRMYIEKMLDRFIPSHRLNAIKHAMPCNPATFNKLTGARSDEERERMKQLPHGEARCKPIEQPCGKLKHMI